MWLMQNQQTDILQGKVLLGAAITDVSSRTAALLQARFSRGVFAAVTNKQRALTACWAANHP